jgi:hypothetical protein
MAALVLRAGVGIEAGREQRCQRVALGLGQPFISVTTCSLIP